MSTELYIPPIKPNPKGYNPANGRFLKGHVPFNKGKNWDEVMPKKSQRRAKRGWKNLEKYRPTSRPDTAGRCRKQTVALTDDGRFFVFGYLGAAAEWLQRKTGEHCSRENIGRCCRENQSLKPKHKPWGKRNGDEPMQQPNTDHRYKGIRWYFESDPTWMEKYNKQKEAI